MINNVILMGRITHDLEIKQTQNGVAVIQFTLAVERRYKGADGTHETDFINCVAWRQQAEFIGKYFRKGRMIAIEGNLRTRTYDDKNGTKHYVTEVYVDNVSFTGEKADSGYQQNDYGNGYQQNSRNNYNNTPSDDFDIISDDGVPF